MQREKRRAEAEAHGKRPVFRGQEKITSGLDQEGSKERIGKEVEEFSENRVGRLVENTE